MNRSAIRQILEEPEDFPIIIVQLKLSTSRTVNSEHPFRKPRA